MKKHRYYAGVGYYLGSGIYIKIDPTGDAIRIIKRKQGEGGGEITDVIDLQPIIAIEVADWIKARLTPRTNHKILDQFCEKVSSLMDLSSSEFQERKRGG